MTSDSKVAYQLFDDASGGFSALDDGRRAEEVVQRAHFLQEGSVRLDDRERERARGDEGMTSDNAHLRAEIVRLEARLAEEERHKDELLAMLAHELRNPLAPMLNAVHILRLGGSLPNPVQQRAVSAMDRQVRHMIRLVDDLLDVARLERGQIQLRKEIVELDAVLEHAVQTSRPLIDDRRHTLTVELPDEIVELDADPARLAQVISNLLNNAAKYTDPGGSIWLRCEQQGDNFLIRVRDNGVGLTEELKKRIFDAFVQSERGIDRAPGGLGLGLTLVRRLVEMHGGSVSAHSEGLGRGAEFLVRLPMPPQSTPARQSSYPRPPSRGPEGLARPEAPALSVLVVDDQADIRETLRDLLEMCGHEVVVAEDGPGAVAMTLARRPDVAIVDIGLPGLDGYQVARRLREEMKSPRRTRLIALSGYGRPDDRRRAIEAGFDAHVVKPVDFKVLTQLITETAIAPHSD